jgi:AhpD family alkylhydroperoxidase
MRSNTSGRTTQQNLLVPSHRKGPVCFGSPTNDLYTENLTKMNPVEQFNSYRSLMNEKILAADNLIIKRIFNLDTNAYQAGILDIKSKELIGLTCSLVLRCDDCVKYHLGRCKDVGFTTAEVHEAMGVATLVGGTIVIPHLRRAFEFWEELSK